MGLFETIADRRIEEGRAAGLFDDLPGKGKPIADLGRERPPGWWAARAVRTERDIERRAELTAEIASARPALWRLGTEAEVSAEVARWNERIDTHNRGTTFQPIDRLDPAATIATWRRLGVGAPRARNGGRR